jgi:WD40 repeat protein
MEVGFEGQLLTQLQINYTGFLAAFTLAKLTSVVIDLSNSTQMRLPLQETVSKLAWHPREPKLGLLTDNSKLWVWDLSTDSSSWTGIAQAVTFAWVDDTLAVVLNDKSVVSVNPYTGDTLKVLLTAKVKLVMARLDQAAGKLVLGTGDGTLYTEQGDVVTEYKLPIKKFTRVVALEVRDSQVYYASSDSNFDVFDLESRTSREVAPKAKVLQVATWCVDVRLLATVCEGDTVDLWQVASGEQFRSFKPHRHRTSSLAWCSGPNLLATGGFDNLICIWNVIQSECVATLSQHNGAVMCLDFELDSMSLASGSRDRSIKVWDISSFVCLNTIDSDSEIEHLKYCTPGLIGSISRSAELKVFEVKSKECLLTRPSPGRLLKQMLAWCCRYSTLAFTDGAEVYLTECPLMTESPLPNAAHLTPVCLAWGAKSLLLAVGYLQKNEVKIWDISSKVCLQAILTEVTGLSSLTWCYSSYLITGGDVVGVWQVFQLWNRVKGFLWVLGRRRRINYQVVKDLANFL